MNNELTSLTLDEYVEDFQQNEDPNSLTDIVQSGGFIRAPSVTPDMVDNQDMVLEEPGALLQNGGCPCASGGKIKNNEFASLQSGGNASVDTNALFQQFLDETQSMASVQSGGDVASVDTNALFQQFLDDNQSMASLQSGGNASVDTNALFQQFLDDNQSMASLQSGGNASVDTNALFQQFLDDNQSMASVQSGGDNVSVDTNALFNKFLDNNVNEMISVQSGGDDSLYSSIASDLMSTGTIDLFSNFVNKHKFKKQMQTGGGDKQVDSKKIMNVNQAVKLLNEVYN
jgi:Tfp pilus assembly protein PilW